MMTFSGHNKVVVQFVKELLRTSVNDSLSITITKPAKSGVCSVSIVTDTSSEDTVENLAQSYLKLDTSTSTENIPAG